MRAQDIIRKKRDGVELTSDEIGFFISGITSGSIPDYQTSAFLMSIYLKGATDSETAALTKAMMHSGEVLNLDGIMGTKVDKHSTGGVGDKPSIILAPLLATMGIKVPMVAGRGLGHTGGTLDKLESIPGMTTDLSIEEFRSNLKNIGCSIMGQTEAIAPADRKLYALRDVTATVESIPLVASSIMSKKLAEGVDGLLLDVKTGSGAFMKDIEDARKLAKTMVSIGGAMGVRTVALITNMDQPLGKTVGNALEIKECITALQGKGAGDLMALTLTITAWMINIADTISEEVALKPLNDFTLRKYKDEAIEFIERGDAFKKFVEFIDAQHGDPEVAFKPNLLPTAKGTKHITAEKSGYIRRLDAEAVGRASMLLGAGRERAEDPIDPAVGIILNKKSGETVQAGEPIAMLHYNDEISLKDAEESFRSGLEIGEKEPTRRPLVLETIIGDKASS